MTLGDYVVATGPVQEVSGHLMIPIEPTGAVEWVFFTTDATSILMEAFDMIVLWNLSKIV